MSRTSKLLIFILTMACLSGVHAQVPPVIVSLVVYDSEGGVPINEGVAQSDNEVFAVWSFASTNPIHGFSYAINEEPDEFVDSPDSHVALGPLDNGVSTFSVLAVDEEGNVGPSTSFDIVVLGVDVAVDIKPGSDPNCFNINGHGVIPVAVLGSDTFDVTNIDQGSLLFGGLEVRIRGKKGPLCNLDYSNGDAYLDLICHFEDDASNWSAGSESATLSGALFDGGKFEGTDSICVVP